MKVNAEIVDHRIDVLISRVIANGVPTAAVPLGKGRNSLYRYMLPGTPALAVSIKDFKIPRFPNSYIYNYVRQSKAQRSLHNSQQLACLGFAVPHPYGYAEVIEEGRLTRSYYLCEHLDGVDELRQWWERPDGEALTRALAAEMLRLHRAGVWHKDFSPGNILFRANADGGYDFYYVDVNRMQFDVHDTGRLYQMFRCITLEREPLRQLAAEYARLAGLDPEQMVSMALGRLEGYCNKKRRLRALKRCFRRR